MSDEKIQGPELRIEHMRKWILSDTQNDQNTLVLFAEQLPDSTLSIRRTVQGHEPRGQDGHVYTLREIRMLKLLLDAVLKDL
jgi:hypothetical protein